MYVHTYLLTYLLFGVYTFLRLTVWTAEWLNVIILGLANDIWIWNSKFVDSHACHLRRSCTTVAQRIWWRRWVELLRAARRRIRAEKTRVRNLDWCPRPKSNWQTVRGRAEWGGGERRRDGGEVGILMDEMALITAEGTSFTDQRGPLMDRHRHWPLSISFLILLCWISDFPQAISRPFLLSSAVTIGPALILGMCSSRKSRNYLASSLNPSDVIQFFPGPSECLDLNL